MRPNARHALLVSILSAPALLEASAASAAEPQRPTILVMPFEGADLAVGDVGWAATLRVLGALEAGPPVNLIHPKQLNRALEQHERELVGVAAPERAKRLARWLGADWIVSGTVKTETGGKTAIAIGVAGASSARSANGKSEAATLLEAIDGLPKTALEALARAGALDAKAAAPADASLITPVTKREAALLEYAGCYRILIRQPIGIREPVVLQAADMEEALGRCSAALEQDPTFADARAALGLAYALRADQKSAETHLAAIKDAKPFLPLYWLGKFWLLGRFYDPSLAVDALRKAADEHPGFLLARGYLGDSLNVLGRHDEALEVFQSYLAAVPKQPWVKGRIGYTESKRKRFNEAIDWTKKGLKETPSDPELLLELASRLIDAGRAPQSEAILKRIISDGTARGEVHLRLGYVHLLSGRASAAEQELVRAIELANSLSEWRTRGRARYDLAKLWMRQSSPDNALRQLKRAFEEGFHDALVIERDPDLKPLATDARYKALLGKAAATTGLPLYISPFPVNPATGNIALEAGGKSKGSPINF